LSGLPRRLGLAELTVVGALAGCTRELYLYPWSVDL